MSERTDTMALRSTDPTDELVFHDYHKPTLAAHTYHLDVTHDLQIRKNEGLKSAKKSLNVRVSGPQLKLPTGSVVSTFPANLASGEYFKTLAHVVLSRGTLPWERLPWSTNKPVSPWMVLLVLDEDEFASARRYSSDLASLPAGITHEDIHPDDITELLELDADDAKELMPPRADLPWLAHVRSVVPNGAPAENETATIMANRLPAPDKQNHAFLLSVEGRYSAATISAPSGSKISFPVLHEWSFFCTAEHEHGFRELLSRLDGAPNHPELFAVSSASSAAATRVQAGFVAVEHQLRDGVKTAGWYHGPLLPGRPPVDASLIENKLPVDAADDLMLIDEDFAMCDVSYAAAWELGRMIMLEHSDIARSTYEWKRSFARHYHRTVQTSPPAANQPAKPKQVLQVKAMHRARLQQPEPTMPDAIEKWIRTSLLELREVPFRYLVPDEELLPASAFRFFDIDTQWIECLRDGAISVGRTDSQAREIETELRKHLPRPQAMSGFLLRNSAVADFPHLEVDAYTAAPRPGEFNKPALPIVRMQRLSPSVLLVIFTGRATAVDLHLHPQAVHFGFSLGPGSGPGHEHFQKMYPPQSTSVVADVGYLPLVPQPIPAPQFPAQSKTPTLMTKRRRIDIAGLASKVAQGRNTQPRAIGSGGVADFAQRMLEGVPLVRFTRTPGAKP